MTGDASLADPAKDGDGTLTAGSGIPPGPPTLDQAFDSGTLFALRSAVHAHTFAAGMPEYRADDVVIAIHELAANVIQHGTGSGRLRMWRVPGALRFQVDDGALDGLRRGGKGGANDADNWPYLKGHGLWLVREVADQMSVYSGPDGTRAAVAFTLPASTLSLPSWAR
jgi:anti-sigma regulatory factor (Ser/Thr protein kinase)